MRRGEGRGGRGGGAGAHYFMLVLVIRRLTTHPFETAHLGGRAHPFVACLSVSPPDHASLSKQSKLPISL